MEEQGILPTLDGPVLAAGPVFVCFELEGRPGHKARHRSRIVIPKESWVWHGATAVIPKSNINKLWIQNYPDPNTAAYEETLAYAGRLFMKSKPPTTNPVALLVHAFREIPKSWSERDRRLALLGGILPGSRPDGDNYLKVVQDALNEIVYRDDSQIVDARVIKRYSDRPGLRIEIREFIVDQQVANACRETGAVRNTAAKTPPREE